MTERKKGILFMIVAAFFFCFTEICMKRINGQLNGLQVNFSRYLFAGLVLLGPAVRELREKKLQLNGKHLRELAVLGLTGITLCTPFYQTATVKLSAGVSSVMFSANPLFVALLSVPILHTAIRTRQKQALVLQILALLVLADPMHASVDPQGLMLLFLAIFFYSLYAVLSKRVGSELGTIPMTSFNFIAGGLQLLFVSLLTHVPGVAGFLTEHGLGGYAYTGIISGYTVEVLPWVVMLYFGVTVGAFVCWFKAMEYGSTALGSLTYFFKPALSPVFAMLLLGETITGRILTGMVLMLLGAVTALLPEPKERS